MNRTEASITIPKPATATRAGYNPLIARAAAEEHLVCLERVQSIVWGLAAGMKQEIAAVEDQVTPKIETAEPEAFVQNVVWLVELLYDNAAGLRTAFEDKEAGH